MNPLDRMIDMLDGQRATLGEWVGDDTTAEQDAALRRAADHLHAAAEELRAVRREHKKGDPS